MSGSQLPPLRPLADSQYVALDSDDANSKQDPHDAPIDGTSELPEVTVTVPDEVALPWEVRGPEAESVECELKAFCRAGELVYAAVVDTAGCVKFSVCTVGARPHNEAEIGDLVGRVFSTAGALGGEVGERQPQALNLQGSRWSYSLDPLADSHLLFGIFSSQALPAIVRACAKKTCAAINPVLAPKNAEE